MCIYYRELMPCDIQIEIQRWEYSLIQLAWRCSCSVVHESSVSLHFRKELRRSIHGCCGFSLFPLEDSRVCHFPAAVVLSFCLLSSSFGPSFLLLFFLPPAILSINTHLSRLTFCFSLLSTTLVYLLDRVPSWLHVFFHLWAFRRLRSCQTRWKTCRTMVPLIPPG